MLKHFWFPYKTCTVTDAINAHASATGSPRYAQQTEHANFNGHRLGMRFNEVRKYWISEYNWAGRNVVARGTFSEVLSASVSFFKNDGSQASFHVSCDTDEQAEKCAAIGMVEWTEEAEKAAYNAYAWWGSEVANAFWLQKNFGLNAVHALATSKSVAEYEEKLSVLRAEKESA